MPDTSTASTNDTRALLRLNRAFYDAFQAMDEDAMERIWAGRDSDISVHPCWPTIHTQADARASWQTAFACSGFVQVTLSDTTLEITGDTARLCCTERLHSLSEHGPQIRTVRSTNIFVRTPSGWRLTLHHGSPAATHPLLVSAVN